MSNSVCGRISVTNEIRLSALCSFEDTKGNSAAASGVLNSHADDRNGREADVSVLRQLSFVGPTF